MEDGLGTIDTMALTTGDSLVPYLYYEEDGLDTTVVMA
jgi:hypothetical protein